MTALVDLIKSKITEQGPINMAEYMSHCLGHPEHGYYTTRDPLGVRGDFTTSPEISQMFGEMLGAWLIQAWVDQGRPTRFILAEAGPGRGTLMRDILRVGALMPDFIAAARIHLIEISPTLREIQAETLKTHPVIWSESLDDLPDDPVLLVANEFFDALPVRQFQRTDTLWRERLVGLTDGQFEYTWSNPTPDPRLDARFLHVPDGTIVEVCPEGEVFMSKLAARLAGSGGSALIIDYGTWEGTGDTVQALANHTPADPLAAPGHADITAHVRFKGLADMATGAQIHGPVSQGVFLERLGITERARALAAKQTGEAQNSIVTAHRRLTHPEEMGNHFKVIGLTPNAAPMPPGFQQMTLEILTGDSLGNIRHGFFTRRGGASSGIYSGLNCGHGSGDQSGVVALNRSMVAEAMRVRSTNLLALHQCHSSTVVTVDPDNLPTRPKADAIVTDEPGIALSVLTADCAPVLLADPDNGVIGAAHAGWRGALDGITDNTIDAMVAQGANRDGIQAAVGPTISQRNYEVSQEFMETFLDENPAYSMFFVNGRDGHYQFDLPSFVVAKLRTAGIDDATWIGACTYAEPDRFYSYRRSTHLNQPDYGRLISAIVLQGLILRVGHARIIHLERNTRGVLGAPDHETGLHARHIGRRGEVMGQEILKRRQIRCHAFQDEVYLTIEHVTLTHKRPRIRPLLKS